MGQTIKACRLKRRAILATLLASLLQNKIESRPAPGLGFSIVWGEGAP